MEITKAIRDELMYIAEALFKLQQLEFFLEKCGEDKMTKLTQLVFLPLRS